MQKLVSRMVRLFMVFAAACCIMAGAGGAMSVKAAQTSQVTEAQAADTEDTAQDDGSGVMLLLGGMLIMNVNAVQKGSSLRRLFFCDCQDCGG